MIVRSIDRNGDWTFGQGRNNYRTDINALGQNLETRLRSFLADCFFDLSAGVDWFTLLGGKSLVALNLAVKNAILNTQFVTDLVELSVTVDASRHAVLRYKVRAAFPGALIENNMGLILTEDGDILTTEDGDAIETER